MIEVIEWDFWGFPMAVKGIREAHKCTHKTDSGYRDCPDCEYCPYKNYCTPFGKETEEETKQRVTHSQRGYIIGPNDWKLGFGLAMAGPDHGKYTRMVHIQARLKAPLYWWKEYDTYKVGTVANSESTMHTMTKYELSLDDFATDGGIALSSLSVDALNGICGILNHYIQKVKDDPSDKETWRAIIQFLPESYYQTRTLDLNYAVLRNMYNQRKNHKLSEWHEFCNWVHTLPYSELITDGK